MRPLKLILSLIALSSAVLFSDVTAQSVQPQKRDTTQPKKVVRVGQDSTTKKSAPQDVNKKRAHKKNANEDKTEKK